MTTHKPQSLSLQVARELLQTGAVRQAVDLGKRGGWALMIRVGMVERPLGLKRGGPSLVQSLDTLSDTLLELGLVEFQVHSSGLEKAADRSRRPLTSE
jgi:hypothetical protein